MGETPREESEAMLGRALLLLLSWTGIPRLIGRLLRDSRVPLRAKLLVLATAVYIVSPFDLVPDMIPLHGWIDDILALLLSSVMFLGMVPGEVLLEHLRGLNSPTAPSADSGKRSGGGGNVIDGDFRRVDD